MNWTNWSSAATADCSVYLLACQSSVSIEVSQSICKSVSQCSSTPSPAVACYIGRWLVSLLACQSSVSMEVSQSICKSVSQFPSAALASYTWAGG